MEVAYFSPLPPQHSGVADYSALILPALRSRFRVRLARRWLRPGSSDVCLYQLGNDPNAHGWIAEALARRRGVVVLHEVVLHELFASLAFARGDLRGYLDVVEQEGGASALAAAHRSLAGLEPPLWETRPYDVPMISPVLARADAVIVHSQFAADQVRRTGYEGPVTRIQMPRPRVRFKTPWVRPEDRWPIICSAGIVNWTKRLPQLLDAFARLRRRFRGAQLVLLGPGAAGVNLASRSTRLGLRLGQDVVDFGYVSEEHLSAVMARSHVCVNLRWPTLGETSVSAIRSLALGRPTVVTDAGWFAELPDSVVVKIPVGGELEVEHLAAVLELLCSDSGLSGEMGAAAQAYAVNEHDLERAADGYEAALRQAA